MTLDIKKARIYIENGKVMITDISGEELPETFIGNFHSVYYAVLVLRDDNGELILGGDTLKNVTVKYYAYDFDGSVTGTINGTYLEEVVLTAVRAGDMPFRGSLDDDAYCLMIGGDADFALNMMVSSIMPPTIYNSNLIKFNYSDGVDTFEVVDTFEMPSSISLTDQSASIYLYNNQASVLFYDSFSGDDSEYRYVLEMNHSIPSSIGRINIISHDVNISINGVTGDFSLNGSGSGNVVNQDIGTYNFEISFSGTLNLDEPPTSIDDLSWATLLLDPGESFPPGYYEWASSLKTWINSNTTGTITYSRTINPEHVAEHGESFSLTTNINNSVSLASIPKYLINAIATKI